MRDAVREGGGRGEAAAAPSMSAGGCPQDVFPSSFIYFSSLFIHLSRRAPPLAEPGPGPGPRPMSYFYLFLSDSSGIPSPLLFLPAPPTAAARRLAARAINPAKVAMNLSLAFASSPTPPAVHMAPCTEPIAQVRIGGGSSSSSGRNRGIDSRKEVYCRC